MEKSEVQQSGRKTQFWNTVKTATRYAPRLKNESGEDLQKTLEEMKLSGISFESVQVIENIKVLVEEYRQDKRYAGRYIRADKLLVGGALSVDVLIFQSLMSLSKFDNALTLAFYLLSVAMPMATGYLIFSTFFRRTGSMSTIISLMSIAAEVATFFALFFIFWHVATNAAIVFFSLSTMLLFLLPISVVAHKIKHLIDVRKAKKQLAEADNN